MDEDTTLGMEAAVGEETVELFGKPLLLTHHAEQMAMRRFRLNTTQEVKGFVSYHLMLSGPGRKRRDKALRWTSEENVQIVTREYSECVLVITCYPLYLYRDHQKTKKMRRPPADFATPSPRQKRSKRYVPEHFAV